jgi:outer membrane lipoprotein-sorting protein
MAAGETVGPACEPEPNMKLRTSWIGLLGVLGVVACACADELETTQKRITEAWRGHKTITAKFTMTSKMEMGGMSMESNGAGTFEFMRKGDKPLVRMELKASMVRKMGGEEQKTEQPILTVVDGEFAYVVTEMQGQKTAFKTTIDPQATGDPEAMLSELRKEENLKLLPEETLDGRKAFVFESTPKEKMEMGAARKVLWFDQASGVLLKLEGYSADGKPLMTMSYSDVKTDVDINPDHFKKPEGVEFIDQTKPAASQP